MNGQVFQRTYRAADGTRKTCDTWTIRYYRNGRPYQEATKYGPNEKGKAQRLLRLRMGDIAKGLPVSPAGFKLTFEDAAADVLNDFTANGKRSRAVVARRLTKHLTPFFGGWKLAEISDDTIRAYIAHRHAQPITSRKARTIVEADGQTRIEPAITRPPSNAEINRELQILKRAYSLNKRKLLVPPPAMPKLRESAPRAGFFERGQFEAVVSCLPDALRGVVTFAFITGWRVPSEVLTLQWHQVNLAAGTIRLDPGQSKTGDGRVFPIPSDGSPLIQELRGVLERQQRARDALHEHGVIVPWVFFRLVAKGRGGPKAPKPIKGFYKAWDTACEAAGCPARIPHDFRRTAVRNLVRSGIPERVAMQMTGHKTRSVFERYNIVSEADLFDAARRYAPDRDSSVTVTPISRRPAPRTQRIS